MKRRKWVPAFLILALLINQLSCSTLFAQELFGSGDSGTDLEEDFTAGLSDPVACADTEFESDASVEPAFSSDVSAVFFNLNHITLLSAVCPAGKRIPDRYPVFCM